MEQKPKRVDPTEAEFEKYYEALKVKAEANRNERILCLQATAGHGFCFRGMQVVINNHFSPTTSYYERLEVESKVREFSPKFPNLFFLHVSACCRSINCIHQKLIKEIPLKSKFQEDMQKEEEKASTEKARGPNDIQQLAKQSNFIFIFGCDPGKGVAADTKTAKDITNFLKKSSSYESDTIKLPGTCSQITSSDAEFEVLTSQTGQTLELQHLGKFAGQMVVYYFFDAAKNKEMQ